MNPYSFAVTQASQPARAHRADCVLTGESAKRYFTGGFTRERGTVLVFAMVMLLILTLLGITAVTTSSLQEKMAGNLRDQYMAQEAGDSILRDGEGWVFKQTAKPTPSCSPNSSERVWNSSCTAILGVETKDDSWWSSNGFLSTQANNYLAQEPRYVVQLLQTVPSNPQVALSGPKKYVLYYRVTGWSVGASNFARGSLQSLFTRKSDEFTN
jgi:type IV pilus assembly protein PilX